MEQVARLADLKILILDGTRVTDKGLRQFHNLQKLKVVSLRDTLVSDAAIRQLRSAVRGLDVLQ